MHPQPVSPKRSEAIDLMRGLSILWIVGFWHVLDYLPELAATKNVVTYHVTVALLGLFVLLSGYLMGRREIPLRRGALREFYLRRFGRIYPPFVLACVAFALVNLQPLETMVRGALLVAMLWGPPPTTLWFITMIVLFYAITPWLAALRDRAWPYIAVVAVVTAGLILAQAISGHVSPRLAMYFPAYAAGLWLARAQIPAQSIAIAGLVLAPVGAWLSAAIPTASIEADVWSTGWALAMPLAIFGLAMAIDHRLRPRRWVGVLAEASYFLYLCHRIVYVLLLKAVHPASPYARMALLMIVALPSAVALSWLGQRWYDALWHRAFRRAEAPVCG